jgi:hypothetical protein
MLINEFAQCRQQIGVQLGPAFFLKPRCLCRKPGLSLVVVLFVPGGVSFLPLRLYRRRVMEAAVVLAAVFQLPIA